MTQVGSIFDQVMSPKCAANVKALLCGAFFKECQQAEDASGSLLWFPSLLCRDECERHQEIWNSCLDDIKKDPEAERRFEKGMLQVVSFVPPIPVQFSFGNGRACFLLQIDLVNIGSSAYFDEGIFLNVLLLACALIRCMLVVLPTGPDKFQAPFRLFDCDVTGDQSQISDEDSAVSNFLIIVDNVQSVSPSPFPRGDAFVSPSFLDCSSIGTVATELHKHTPH
jgi:hypothetical protein